MVMPSTVMLSRALAICASPKLARSFSRMEATVSEAGTVMLIVMKVVSLNNHFY